ncbi:MAG TPA: glycosyl hydrolase [Thermoanaerobaculia bacterium]|nr:glycosyl hydrolase [Thermoanaerobaculia bacterium]
MPIRPRLLARRCLLALLAAAFFAVPAPAVAAARKEGGAKPPVDPRLFDSLRWREVGPYRGGRSAAVAGVPQQRDVYYFGSTGGGVWKTTDGGRSWKPVSDGFFGGSIGAVAVSEWDPNVVYVGGGEKTVRGNVSHGEGVWKSTDAGRSWRHVGLGDSRHIPRIRIHPRDPELVYAAVLGHLFGPSDMRGVYRSRNGGRSWERVLFAGRDAGAVDLVLDPTNPRVLYAATWRVRRRPWTLESGGPGSGIWKSSDGGDTWRELTRKPGLPKGTLGIIGVAVSPADPQNVYAIVEAEEGGVFRSRDGGESWTKTNESRDLRQRAWYYTRIYADPQDADTVYVVNVQFHKSKDGGKTFTTIRTPHGDNHDLWIDPGDPRRMIESNDGGANVSTDGGETWTPQDNQPTAQLYRVSTDTAFPYRLLGGQQDNTAVRIKSRGTGRGIGSRDWEPTAGGESGWIAADPEDPDIVYGGSYGGYLERYDHGTSQFRSVDPWPENPMGAGAADLKYRFQWNYPIFFSPHDPNTLYAAANVLFKTTDEGASWQPISPDLTRNDKTKMGPSGGPITKDNTSVEYYGTIFAAAESPHEAGVLWAGSDDGLIHLSRDAGASWQNVTPRGMPEWIQVNSVEPSPHEKGGLYVAATMYKSDDFRPYLWKTSDYGRSWTRIDRGIAADHFTRVVRADPARRGLLYAGTERGVYVSFDDGGSWQPLQLNLPIVPVTDLVVKDGDLAAATQGRGFWILDDLSPLHRLAGETTGRRARLLPPRPSRRLPGAEGEIPAGPNQGTNGPNGVVVHYWLDQPEGTEVKLEFLDGQGRLVRAFEGKVEPRKQRPWEKQEEPAAAPAGEGIAAGEESQGPEAAKPEAKETPQATGATTEAEVGEEKGEEEKGEEEKEKKKKKDPAVGEIKPSPGMNRFVWDLRYPDAAEFEGMILWGGGIYGPRAVPGDYQVRLTAGKEVETADFSVGPDPRSTATPADLEAQHAFLLGVRDKLTAVHREIGRIRAVRAELDELEEQLGAGEAKEDEAVAKAIAGIRETTKAVEEALYQTKNRSAQDPLNFPIRLNDKLAALGDTVAAGDNAPTAQAVAVRDALVAAIDQELARLQQVWTVDLPALNTLVRGREVPAVPLPPLEGAAKPAAAPPP